MPVTRSSSRIHGSPNIYISSSLPNGRPVRRRQPSRRLQLALESIAFSMSQVAAPSSPSAVEASSPSESGTSDTMHIVESSPSTTPPVTPTPSDFTDMSTSTPGPRTRQMLPVTPTRQMPPVTPTPVLGLHRTYASFFSPEDQRMALAYSPALTSPMDTKSDTESTPRATIGKFE